MNEETMELRPSRVLDKLRAGEVVLCTKINPTDPRVVEIAARCGFDCVWLDTEHTPTTLHDMENQIRAAKMHDVDTLVRVQRGSYSDLIHPLEMDAAGIMVPHVMSLADAKSVARQTRFHPIGRRPIDGGNSDGAYCMIPTAEYARQANERRFVIVQIEDPEPLDELEQIAQVEGIDMLFFGPNDFAHGIGKTGQSDDPRIEQTRRRIPQVARKYGKFAAVPCGVEGFESAVEMGYQFLSIGADVVSLWMYYREILSAVRGRKP